MPTKIELLHKAYQQHCLALADPEQWQAFLSSACKNYKCRFDEQVLIFDQCPHATAVLEIEKWNKFFHRWVNRGANGIAVFDSKSKMERIKYYFDVSDTHEVDNARPVPIWEMREEYEDDVIASLERKFGELKQKGDLTSAIFSAAENAADEYLSDHLSDLMNCRENSFLEEVDPDYVRKTFRDLSISSVAYMLLTRCGYPAADYLDNSDFRSICEFNTQDTMNAIGLAASDISELALREISATVFTLQKNEKKQIRTFASSDKTLYNKQTPEPHHERMVNHENNLHAGGRLQPTKSSPPTNRDTSPWEVRTTPQSTPRSAPPSTVHQPADILQTDRTSSGNRGEREQSDGTTGAGYGETDGRDRGTEINESDGVGGQNEQHSPHRGRDGTGGFDLQLSAPESTLLPSIEEQLNIIEQAEVEQASAFVFSQEEIDQVLQLARGVFHSKKEIYKHFLLGKPTKENVAFLKNVYGTGGVSPVSHFLNISERHDKKGMTLSRGGDDSPTENINLSWQKIAKRIGELIQQNRYLTIDEKEAYNIPLVPIEEMAQLDFSQFIAAPETEVTQPSATTTETEVASPIEIETVSSPNEDNAENKQGIEVIDSIPYESVDDEIIGKELTLYNRQYRVDSVKSNGEVSLQDITFREHTGYPIFRVETKGYITHLLAEQSASAITPEQTDAPAMPAATPPSIQQEERKQFKITDSNLGHGKPREKFRANIAAIQVLQQCEAEDRLATAEEQDILSGYVGWGGLADAFDEHNTAWQSEYNQLKSLLTNSEYTAARESTLTAFYTPPMVINAMYQALENMGFHQGNILEPACGIGNFIGTLPSSMENSKVYGVELDDISGRIAKQLYQQSKIAVQGYEKTMLPDNFFDVAIGNVPFGQFKVLDARYDKHNFLIHDFFFAKTLDKVRSGGVVAFITSKGTMDKENHLIRKYLSQRARFIGAIRLPNTTFKANAGTDVTSDIIFLQKRDHLVDKVDFTISEGDESNHEIDWLHLNRDENGIRMNQYFIDHPEMVLGEMQEISGPFGPETACIPQPEQSLQDFLEQAVQHLQADFVAADMQLEVEIDDTIIPADPSVRNFSFTEQDGSLYFRENSIMKPVAVSDAAQKRIKGMIPIRDCARKLITLQTEGSSDSEIEQAQQELNSLYDAFSKKHGLLNSRGNSTAFSLDSSYALLCSLEVLDSNGALKRKADMFHKRTIKPHCPVTAVDTASEALAVSIAEKAGVDMPFMETLSGKSVETLAEELQGVIFALPSSNTPEGVLVYQSADEYLSGNVRQKLAIARTAAFQDPSFESNVKALENVQPTDLTASEIAVRLGSTWIPSEIINQFLFELLGTPYYKRHKIKVHFSSYTSEWNIAGKAHDKTSIAVTSTYGTERMNAYKIIEETLNLRDVRVFDYEFDENGNRKAVLNKKETAIAQGKQEQIKSAFEEWIWKDHTRREELTTLYNEKFNSIRPREYDGSHIIFVGMNPEIKLRKHQINAIAHILYGGNTLLAHVVGAGKTFEMVAAAMESKRLGLCNKPMFVVPNHLTEQWASEFLQLYPAANILVATKKEFDKKNRKRFCGRIATGDYDAIIIGHSQFEKIPMSAARQRQFLEEQKEELLFGIQEAKSQQGDRFTVKQLEKTKKKLETKLELLNDQSRKDDVVTFEELGVDRLFIDESHYYKNLFLHTKMRNVAGIGQSEAQKSSDLFMKSRYLNEVTGGRGLVFATGTPISNSMVEMYTVQRYLQYQTLVDNNLQHFDAWASTFGETITAIELSPEGTGYRAKTRFSKFYNLPELMCMFKEVADIQTADMLDLPVPIANYHNVSVKPSKEQVEMVADLAERAELVRNREVEPDEDNMRERYVTATNHEENVTKAVADVQFKTK